MHQKQADRLLTDRGEEALRLVKGLQELIVQAGLKSGAAQGLRARAAAQNSNQDLVDIHFKWRPSWKDL